MPAQGAVAIAGHHEAAVGADVDRPHDTGPGLVPQLFAVAVEQAQVPLGAEREALTVRRDRQAAGALVLFEREWPPVERRVVAFIPVLDAQPRGFGARGGKARVVLAQRAGVEVEAAWILTP